MYIWDKKRVGNISKIDPTKIAPLFEAATNPQIEYGCRTMRWDIITALSRGDMKHSFRTFGDTWELIVFNKHGRVVAYVSTPIGNDQDEDAMYAAAFLIAKGIGEAS